MKKNNKIWKVVGLVAITVIILGGVFIANQIGPYDKKNNKDIVVSIPSGSGVGNISSILYENKLIKDKGMFELYAKFSSKVPQIKAGTYLLNQTYSNGEIIDLLASGKIHHVGKKITIPEGSTSNEIIDILTKNNIGTKENYESLINNPSKFYDRFSFLKEEDITSLEGFLYPETYFIDEKATEEEALTVMLSGFNSVYTDEVKSQVKKSDMTLQQIVNLASIVEKEAVKDEDRPIIAGVFYNRLDIGMPLQSDATIQYAFEERKNIVTYADLEIDSPYNSYKNKGLPPTPIASPGIKSIEATLNPKDTDYLYFVAKMDGGNNYSETYDQHLIYVEQYREERDKLNKENK